MSAARLDIRVMPRSPRSGLDGVRDGRLIVRVTAPPVDGDANAAAIATLADALAVPRRDVRIVTGASGRNKTIEVRGLSGDQLRQWLRLNFPA